MIYCCTSHVDMLDNNNHNCSDNCKIIQILNNETCPMLFKINNIDIQEYVFIVQTIKTISDVRIEDVSILDGRQ